MANELQISAQGDTLNTYAVIRKATDLTVWNGTAFETWVDANIVMYAVAMPTKKGDVYAGDFPTAIDSGLVVRIHYYKRAGSVAAITDLLLNSRELAWTGVALVPPAGSVTASACAIVSLIAAKRFLRITDSTKDDLIQQLINQQSARISRVIGRDLCATDYVEFYRVDPLTWFPLRQYPVQYVTRVAAGNTDAITVSYTGAAIRAMISVTDTGVRLTSTTAAGVTTNTTLPFVTYPTFSTMATAIAATTGWTATASVDGLSNNLHRISGRVAVGGGSNGSIELSYPDYDYERYEANEASGLLKLGNLGFGGWFSDGGNQIGAVDDVGGGRVTPSWVMVEYRAGYETVPEDLQGVALELISLALSRSGDTSLSNLNIKSESIGDYSYTVSDSASQATAISDDAATLTSQQMGILSPYMRARVGGML